MKIEEFKELEKENKYISNLLTAHQENIQEKIEEFFKTLHNDIHQHGFSVCIHTHYFPTLISVFNGLEKDSDRLSIQNFKIIDKTNNFNIVVMELVEDWLKINHF